MRDYGWKCGSCGHLNKHLELDLEFGKRRETLTCDDCGETSKYQEVDRIFLESDISQLLKKNLNLMDSLVAESTSEEARLEVGGRKKELEKTASSLGLQLYSNKKMRKCIYCGESTSVHQDACSGCGEEDWMPEKTGVK